jgi:DNA replication protein DnaC
MPDSTATKAASYTTSWDTIHLSHAEWLGLLLEREWSSRYDRKLAARLRFAKLRHQATPEDVDYRAHSGLDRALFMKLLGGDWIGAHDNLAICGPSGVGKSWLACALGHKACRDDRSVSISGSHDSLPSSRSPAATADTLVCNAPWVMSSS